MELPEELGLASRDAITLPDAEFDLFAGAGTFTTFDECAFYSDPDCNYK